MKKIVNIISLLLLAVIIIWGYSEMIANSFENQISKDTLELVNKITNEDVAWDGTFIGLMPKLGGATLRLRDSKKDINPLLVEALLDQDKFVAAHVLLTYRTALTISASGSEWNGLKVQLKSNGETAYDDNDLNELQKYWMEKLGK